MVTNDIINWFNNIDKMCELCTGDAKAYAYLMQECSSDTLSQFYESLKTASRNEYSSYETQKLAHSNALKATTLTSQSCIDTITDLYSPDILRLKFLQCVKKCNDALALKSKLFLNSLNNFASQCTINDKGVVNIIIN